MAWRRDGINARGMAASQQRGIVRLAAGAEHPRKIINVAAAAAETASAGVAEAHLHPASKRRRNSAYRAGAPSRA